MSKKPYLNVIRWVAPQDIPNENIWSVESVNAYLEMYKNEGYVVKTAQHFAHRDKEGNLPVREGLYYFLELVEEVKPIELVGEKLDKDADSSQRRGPGRPKKED